MAKLAKLTTVLDQYAESKSTIQLDIVDFKQVSLTAFSGFEKVQNVINEIKTIEDIRFLCRYHLFFLLIVICKRRHLLHTWTENRCIDCQKSPNGQLQLWPREHFKSSIWTFGRTIQDILTSHGDSTDPQGVSRGLLDALYHYFYAEAPLATAIKKFAVLDQFSFRDEVSVGIFSATRTLAQAFLKEIMLEFENNELLQDLFPEILYKNPKKFSSSWSFTHGITVKRKTIRRECTIEAWGVLEGQPTSKHFTICIFDDIVTEDIAKSLVLNQKLVERWQNAFSLGSVDGAYRAQGTRKHYNDPYSQMIERDVFKEIKYLPRDENNVSVLMPDNVLLDRQKSAGPLTWAAEYLQEPLKDSALGFNLDHIMYHDIECIQNLALYMICDPASSKKRHSDYTAMVVVGVDQDSNLILLDGIRDRLNPSERWEALFSLYRQFLTIRKIFYESVGMNNDLFYFKEQMNREGHFFNNKFIELNPKQRKLDRIVRLEPLIEQQKLFLPRKKLKVSVAKNTYDLVEMLLNEELAKFPFCPHDDLLDVLAYAAMGIENKSMTPLHYDDKSSGILYEMLTKQANDDQFLRQPKY